MFGLCYIFRIERAGNHTTAEIRRHRGRSMEIRLGIGSTNTKDRTGIVIGLLFAALLVWIIVNVAGHHSRHKHLTKLVKTKNHRIYAENHDGSCYEFVDSGGSYASDINLPKSGSSSFKMPSGSWMKASPPKEEEIAEEEGQWSKNRMEVNRRRTPMEI